MILWDFPFFFLWSPTANMAEPILAHDGSYDAFIAKEVPFGGPDDEKIMFAPNCSPDEANQ